MGAYSKSRGAWSARQRQEWVEAVRVADEKAAAAEKEEESAGVVVGPQAERLKQKAITLAAKARILRQREPGNRKAGDKEMAAHTGDLQEILKAEPPKIDYLGDGVIDARRLWEFSDALQRESAISDEVRRLLKAEADAAGKRTR